MSSISRRLTHWTVWASAEAVGYGLGHPSVRDVRIDNPGRLAVLIAER